MLTLFQFRSDYQTNESGRRKDYFIDSFFYDCLVRLDTYDYSAPVQRWFRALDIFYRERVFMVINKGNYHFFAVAIYMTDRRIVIMDSLAKKEEKFHRDVFANVMHWLKDEWEDKKGTTRKVGNKYSENVHNRRTG